MKAVQASNPIADNTRAATAGTVKTFVRLSQTEWRVNTGVFMSDGTHQEGICTLTGNVLRFKGWMNKMPFRITLGEISLRRVLVMNLGQTIEISPFA